MTTMTIPLADLRKGDVLRGRTVTAVRKCRAGKTARQLRVAFDTGYPELMLLMPGRMVEVTRPAGV